MRIAIIGALLALTFAAAACTSTEHLRFDGKFAELDAKHRAARAAHDATARSAAEAELAELAGKAATAARAARADRRHLDAVSNYRVAASATWRAGRGGTIDIAREGVAVCQDTAKNAAEPQRDCLFLEIVQPMAAIDHDVDRLLGFEQRIQEVRRLPPDQRKKAADDAEGWAGNVIANIRELSSKVPTAENALPPGMLQYGNEQIHAGYCRGAVKAVTIFDNPELRDYSNRLKAELARESLTIKVANRLGRPPNNRAICADM